jgi:Carbohydrate binding domain (family 11)
MHNADSFVRTERSPCSESDIVLLALSIAQHRSEEPMKLRITWWTFAPIAAYALALACTPEAADTGGLGGETNDDGAGGKPIKPDGGSAAAGGKASGGTASGGHSSSGGALAPTLVVCDLPDGGASVADSSKDPVFDDFDDGEPGHAANGTRGFWYTYDDETDGTQSPTGSNVEAVPGGVTSDGFALRVQASGFSKWGSGFGTNFAAASSACLFDASAWSGFSFWAKGSIALVEGKSTESAGQLKISIMEKDIVPLDVGGLCNPDLAECWDSHKIRVELTDCWQQHVVRFSDLKPDNWGKPAGELNLQEFYGMVFEVTQNQTSDVWIDDIRFFADEPEAAEALCEGMGGASGEGGATGQ